MAIETLNNVQLKKMGSFDKGGRFYLDDIFETETSRQVRSPSRAWPLSVWKHCKTIKFRKSMTRAQCDMVGVPFVGSEEENACRTIE